MTLMMITTPGVPAFGMTTTIAATTMNQIGNRQ